MIAILGGLAAALAFGVATLSYARATRYMPTSAVLGSVDDQLADGRGQTSFLSPYPTDRDPDGHLRVTALACPGEPPYHLVAVVLVGFGLVGMLLYRKPG